MKSAEQILTELEAACNGHDDGNVYTSGHGVWVCWDGDFEYYLDMTGLEPVTREQALAKIAEYGDLTE